ncbi:uncharacterized protein SETTUDRAFT_156845 [Exserohilum turcica Et28A]|uniref:Uncharacterized protein n=1 Tax=Exserohilum turcicum (strain 28A) TaxID=671987 RepID=R0JKZ0_EXST2|nr:uncharacterized protein SETTUDRAFT_156845 [Exserohilum turcica Et28A]EOA81958.1 hypothetical protein SETTUDRAFT_156845 [Exserohilum turcica Et28A]
MCPWKIRNTSKKPDVMHQSRKVKSQEQHVPQHLPQSSPLNRVFPHCYAKHTQTASKKLTCISELIQTLFWPHYPATQPCLTSICDEDTLTRHVHSTLTYMRLAYRRQPYCISETSSDGLIILQNAR